jgi:hypothetical protein
LFFFVWVPGKHDCDLFFFVLFPGKKDTIPIRTLTLTLVFSFNFEILPEFFLTSAATIVRLTLSSKLQREKPKTKNQGTASLFVPMTQQIHGIKHV